MSTGSQTKLKELQNSWTNLRALANQRRDALNIAHTNHKFLFNLKELELWVADATKRMTSNELPNSISEAQAALELHHERKVKVII